MSLLSTFFSLSPLPQGFSLNCCGTLPSRRKHGETLRQNRLFRVFAAVIKFPFPRDGGKPIAPLLDFTGIYLFATGKIRPFSPIRFRRFLTEGKAVSLKQWRNWQKSGCDIDDIDDKFANFL